MMPTANPGAGPAPAPAPDPQNLVPFGWTAALSDAFRRRHPGLGQPGRVVAATRGQVLAQTAFGEIWCTPTGRLRERLRTEGLALCAGDWIAFLPQPGTTRALVLDLLPRGASLARQDPGAGGGMQWLAVNLEVVLLLMGLDRDFNLPRLERLLALAWGSGARPVVALTKADLQQEVEARIAEVQALAPGVQVLAASSVSGRGLAEIRACLPEGCTGAMIGSSGVGKSTLLNALAGQELRRTQAVRAADGRGRHTTTLRELFLLPQGGCLIDTPGIREVGLAAGSSDLDAAFQDITSLAADCRFSDCSHGTEPGCAVQAALADGRLDPRRYASHLRLHRELAHEAARGDVRLRREREQKWRTISRINKRERRG